MRHLTLGVVVALAVGLAPASAGLDAKPPTLVFASFRAIEPGQPGSQDTVADLFLLRGNVVTRRLSRTSQWEEYPAWSPDGRRIAFSKGDSWCQSNFCERRPIDGSIWVRRVRGGAARRITRSESIDRAPTWSPDGKWIAFARVLCCDDDPEHDGIYRIRPDGTNMQRIYAIRARALDWSPDGSTIAFVSESGRVRLLDVESGEAPRLLITNITGGKEDIDWSPRGGQLAVASTSGVYVVGAKGGRARRVVKARAGSYAEIAPSVSWSPDGRRLAFSTAMSKAEDARTDIFVVGVNGRGLTKLTTNAGGDFDPDWRPR